MAKLTGGISVNPLPESISDKDLSEEFADFFLLKILKIRENLDKYEKFEPNCESLLFNMENFKGNFWTRNHEYFIDSTDKIMIEYQLLSLRTTWITLSSH